MLPRNPLVAALVAALTLTGCSARGADEGPAADGEPRVVQPGAPGQPSRTLSPDELAELEQPGYTDADVRFVQGMIQHHAQALRMTGLVARSRTSNGVRLLARRMDLSQESEVELMERWLQGRGQEAPALHRVHGHAHGPLVDERMPGMATEAELVTLEAATGRAFERLFLELMIRHHEGALTMVRGLRASGGGLESELDAFARHVEADQQIEIARMHGLRKGLGI